MGAISKVVKAGRLFCLLSCACNGVVTAVSYSNTTLMTLTIEISMFYQHESQDHD